MLIELSYPLSETTPKWPTNPDEQYYSVSDQTRGDVSTTSSVYHHMHNGTHMDTPRHFDPNGPTIEQLPIEDFYYTRPFVLRLDKKKGEMVTMQDVQAHLDELKTCDLLLIYTGYSSLRAKHPEQFMDDFPFLSPQGTAAAESDRAGRFERGQRRMRRRDGFCGAPRAAGGQRSIPRTDTPDL